ncbi:translocation/assembly module TamB domain-containing protein [Devosia sp. ZB163]|uniref:translocation/assembly module TamB domain-containing protein n=1 Tax=Devosia sp. ZB163 TaxID=3025938 RepID=UPI00235E6F2D|nr:translocation/assembly module TamB domain-containing protein [Devosia sp. ZB163]MDC9824884.1 translocation/assembly module TamB domain-containing protein [Devosia sp. ZB163]
MRRLVALFMLIGLGLLAAMPLVAQDQAQMTPEQQKDWFVQFVEGQLSTPERQIRISNIDGALSSTASIREVTISDKEGVWLRINNAAIDWDQGALFTGRLLVRSLSADSIDYIRNAIPTGDRNLPGPEAAPMQVPEFPVAVQLDKLSVPKVTFGESVFGLGSEISVEGNLRLEGGSLDTALDIVRLDGPGGRLDADIAYRKGDNTIDIGVTLTEPPNGILANLLNIEGRPEVALAITGSGPVADLRTTMTLDADGKRALTGEATLVQAADGLKVDADLGGPIGDLVAPAYRPFFGAESALKASALVRSSGGVEISAFQLSGGQLSVAGSGATTEDGFLNRLQLSAAIADTAGGVVTLPVPGAATTIEGAILEVDYGTGSSDGWTANLVAKGFVNGGLRAEQVTLKGSGVAANLEDPATRRVTFNADGAISGIVSEDPDVQAALGTSAGLGLAGLWNAGEPVQLAELRISGEALSLAMRGNVDNWVFDGKVGIETSSIAPFSGVAGRDLDGALTLDATGTISPLIGGFNLTLDGTAENLALAEPALDKVLAGTVRMTGRVARTEKGLEAEAFRLGNDRVQIVADGTFATGAADFTFTADLTDLALVSDQAKGALNLTGTAKGQGSIALDVTATVPSGRLAGKVLNNASFGFKGTLAEKGTLNGALTGDAFLDRFRVELTGDVATDTETRRLSGLRLTAGPTQLTGDIVQDGAGLLTGQLILASSDISTAAALMLVDATGSANARITFTPEGGKQGVQITGTAREIRASDVRVASADINAQLADLFGNLAIDGSFNARSISTGELSISELTGTATQRGGQTSFVVDGTASGYGLSSLTVAARGSIAGQIVTLDSATADGGSGLRVQASGRVPLSGPGLQIAVSGAAPLAFANRFVSDRGGQFSGTATLDANVTGSLSSPQFVGTVSTSGSGYIDPELNIRLVDINGRASLRGDTVFIDSLTAGLATGGSVSASGSVGLGAGNPVDVAVRLNSARYADGTLFVATVSGDLALRGRMDRDPVLSGNVLVEKADITVPDSFGGAGALVDVRNVNTPPAVVATLKRAAVTPSGAPMPQRRPSVVQLDVNVAAPNQIFVRGRGLDAEVGGSVRLTGSVNDIHPVGGFELNRGRLAILGQRVTFEEGLVTLVGDLDPFLDFTARTEGDDITVVVNVTGRVSELDVSFSSNPPLPQDEVMSRLLFKRSMGELTPLQLAKLAGAAAELAGGGSSLAESLRARAGLDDFDIVTNEEGGLAVQAGTYLQDNIYLGVQAGADGNSRVTVNLDITNDLKAKVSTGTDGDTSVGVFYETDY